VYVLQKFSLAMVKISPITHGSFYLQTENSPYQYRGMFHALSTVLREEGPRALYKGWFPSVIGVVSEKFSI
jgi:hypothetical protein